jgi:hypothetical protein
MRSLTPISILLLITSITFLPISLKVALGFTIGAIFSLFFQLILRQHRTEKMIVFNIIMAFILIIIEVFIVIKEIKTALY